jgi:hypothetical protein
MKRILRLISYILAALYFCVDVIFARVARPLSTWIARQVPLKPVRDWICSLSPYPSLALFSVPVILLEPVKFVAAYLAATGNVIYAGATFVVGEILKLVMIERLFDLTRKNCSKFPPSRLAMVIICVREHGSCKLRPSKPFALWAELLVYALQHGSVTLLSL